MSKQKQQLIDFFGSQNKLAEALGLCHSAPCRWGEHIPKKFWREIELLSEGKFTYAWLSKLKWRD